MGVRDSILKVLEGMIPVITGCALRDREPGRLHQNDGVSVGNSRRDNEENNNKTKNPVKSSKHADLLYWRAMIARAPMAH